MGATRTMKDCNCIHGIESLFNEKEAQRSLKSYHKSGPTKTTRLLLDALRAEGIKGMTLLDIGGGVGAIQHELLRDGASRAAAVDASTAYIKAARSEAERQGHADKVEYHHGNFVELAPRVSPADIVTLDRVICCYHDMPALVGSSVGKAERLYGLVYPRDIWWIRAGIALANLYFKIARNPFRSFVHPTEAVNRVVEAAGFSQRFHGNSGVWQVVVYARPS